MPQKKGIYDATNGQYIGLKRTTTLAKSTAEPSTAAYQIDVKDRGDGSWAINPGSSTTYFYSFWSGKTFRTNTAANANYPAIYVKSSGGPAKTDITLTFPDGNYLSMQPGETAKANVVTRETVSYAEVTLPAGELMYEAVSATTDDPTDIFTVDASGTVTALKAGSGRVKVSINANSQLYQANARYIDVDVTAVSTYTGTAFDVTGNAVLKWANPNASYKIEVATDLPEGSTTFKLESNGIYYLCPAEGYDLTKVINANGVNETIGNDATLGQYVLIMGNSEPASYTVETEKKKFRVIVTDGSKVDLYNYTDQANKLQELAEGENALSLEEGYYYFVSQEGYRLTSVTDEDGANYSINEKSEYFPNTYCGISDLSKTYTITTEADQPAYAGTTFNVALTGEGAAVAIKHYVGTELISDVKFTTEGEHKYTLDEGTTYYVVATDGSELTEVTADGEDVTLNAYDLLFGGNYAELSGLPEIVYVGVKKEDTGDIITLPDATFRWDDPESLKEASGATFSNDEKSDNNYVREHHKIVSSDGKIAVQFSRGSMLEQDYLNESEKYIHMTPEFSLGTGITPACVMTISVTDPNAYLTGVTFEFANSLYYSGRLKCDTGSIANETVWTPDGEAVNGQMRVAPAGTVQTVNFTATGETPLKSMTVTSKSATTGIESTETVQIGTVTYFDLQGRRVENPSAGIYIRVAGNRTDKVIVK